jgi:hypothetical protein
MSSHHDGRAQVEREQPLLGGAGEGLQRAGVVARADHREGLALALEGMQVEQHVVPLDERAQHIGHPAFIVGRRLAGLEQAIEVALALPLQASPRERIGHGQQGELAAQQLERAAVELGQHALDAHGAAGFVAVHPAQHQQPRAGVQRGEGVDAQAVGGGAGKRIIGRHPADYCGGVALCAKTLLVS